MPADYLTAPRPGLPLLLRAIQRDPLGMAQQFRRNHGDIVGMTGLLQPIHYVFYVFAPDAARQVLALLQDHLRNEERQLRVFRARQGRNVLSPEARHGSGSAVS